MLVARAARLICNSKPYVVELILIVGLSLFLVFQTIPILVRNPPPVGFGGDAISTTTVQLPFAFILLVFGPASGFIISKVGTTTSLIIGTVISTVGFFGLFLLTP